MRVFLSWSQRRSGDIAAAWQEFLPNVIQSIRTFLSSADLDAGVRWTSHLADALGDMDHGILLITPENKMEPWIHFEAGALSKNVGTAKVMPCLYDVQVAQLPATLAQFNCRMSDRAGVWGIVTSINNDLKEGGLDPGRLRKAFEKHFPDFEATIAAIPPLSEEEKAGVQPDKTVEQMVAEILTTLRRTTYTPSVKGYERVAVMEFDQIVREMIDAQRRHADVDLWHLFSRRLFDFTKTWAGLLSSDLDLEIRTVATECTLISVAKPEDRENRIEGILRHACSTANSLKSRLLGVVLD